MTTALPRTSLFILLIVFACSAAAFSQTVSPVGASRSGIGTVYGRTSFEFIPNKGQLGSEHRDILYYCSADGVWFFMTRNGMRTVFTRSTKNEPTPPSLNDSMSMQSINMSFVGANPSPRIEALDTTAGYLNFFLSGSRITGVRTMQRIIYHDLYPKIDLILYTTGNRMKYDLIVHPGGNPNSIVMRYSGADSLALDIDGTFSATTRLGVFNEEKPYCYQTPNAKQGTSGLANIRNTVVSRFSLTDNDLRFSIGQYDRTRDLVIDPQRLWATYYGGTGDDYAEDIAINHSGEVIVSGVSLSGGNIASTGAYQTTGTGYDAFLVKFDATGVRQWGTYYGGNNPDTEYGLSIDINDNIVIAGATQSGTGIATAGTHQTSIRGSVDAYLAKFNTNGTLMWGTYFGGDSIELFGGFPHSVAFDPSGYIFLGGSTLSSNGIATAGAFKTTYGGPRTAFLAKFTPNGTVMWSTYFGTDTYCNAVAADSTGDVLIAGGTQDASGIATIGTMQTTYKGGPGDAYIAKFDGNGFLQWGTYYGDLGVESLNCLAVDVQGSIYASGNTTSSANISTPGVYQMAYGGSTDGMILKLTSIGTLRWATYLGGTATDYGYYVSVTAAGVLCTGLTFSSSGFATANEYQTSNGGRSDAYLVKLSSTGRIVWGTFYGGSQDDKGYGATFDYEGNPLMVGTTSSTSNIATSGSHQSTYGGGIGDGFIVRFCDMVRPKVLAAIDTICPGSIDTVFLTTGYPITRWFDGGVALPTADDSTYYAVTDSLTPGLHRFYAQVSTASGCTIRSDTARIFVRSRPGVEAGVDKIVCLGSGVGLTPTVSRPTKAPYTYQWSPATGLNNPSLQTPTASPADTTMYYVTITDGYGCTGIDSVRVNVIELPQISIKRDTTVCPGTPVVIGGFATGATGPYTYRWSTKNGLNDSTIAMPTASPKTTTTYRVTVTAGNGCKIQDSVTVTVLPAPKPIITPSGNIGLCGSDTVTLRVSGGTFLSYQWNVPGETSDSLVVRTSGKYVVNVTDGTGGCKGISDTVYVTITPTLVATITISGPAPACEGDTIALSAPTGYSSYRWNTGNAADTTNRILVGKTGMYVVDVINSKGCKGKDSIQVTINPRPKPSINGSGTVCLNSFSDYVINAMSGSKRVWRITPSALGTIFSGQGTGQVNIQWGNTPGVATVTVVETSPGGCIDSASFNVTISTGLFPQLSPPGPIAFCPGDSITLDAGSGFATYQWSNNASQIPGATNQTLTVFASGSYHAAVTNSSGCSGVSDTISVTVFPAPAKPVITNTGGTLTSTFANTYQWYQGNTLIPGQNGQNFTPTQSGSYSVRITDANGCSNISDPITVTIGLPVGFAVVRIGTVAPATPGQPVDVPVDLDLSSNLTASGANHYVGTVRFNATLLMPVGVRGGTILNYGTVNTTTKERTVVFEGNSNGLTNGTLQTLEFVAALGNDSCTQIYLDSLAWTDAVVNVTRQNGQFCETGICRTGTTVRLLEVTGTMALKPGRPNPASDRVVVEYSIVEDGQTELELTDMLGRRVMVVVSAEQKPGGYISEVNLSGVPSGLYVWQLRTRTQSLRQVMMVRK